MRTSFVVLALAIATPAHAEQVGVVVTGEATLQPQVAAQLEGWLHDRGRTVVPGPLEPSAINTLIDCFVLEDLACAQGLIDSRSKSNAVVYARVEVTPTGDGTRQIAITGTWFQKNHEPIAERRVCEACTDEALHGTVEDLMLALVHEPPPPAAGAPPSTPAAGPAPASPAEDGTRRAYVPYGLMVAGSVALVAGGIMVAIDQDPSPVGPQSATYRDTATGGAVLGIAGAAALAAGIYLWFDDRRTSTPVAAVSHDTAVVGWTGRF
jgi:hypothetical protein